MKKLSVPLIILVLFLWQLPSIVSPEIYSVEKVRVQQKATTIELSQGAIEYEDIGRGDTAVLLIAGFSIPFYVWDRQIQPLVDANWRTIRYNHFSRGLSDYPKGVYSRKDYAQTALELLDSLKVSHAIIIGHSMGGPIASEIALADPKRIVSVILADPMLDRATGNIGVTMAKMPVIGSYLTRLLCTGEISKRANTLLSQAGIPEKHEYRNIFSREVQTKGFNITLNEILTSDLMENYSEGYRALGQKEMPILLFSGEPEKDEYAENMNMISSLLPGAAKLHFPGASHLLHMEHHDVFNRALLAFLDDLREEAVQKSDSLPIYRDETPENL